MQPAIVQMPCNDCQPAAGSVPPLSARPQARLTRDVVTVLFADLEGFTRLTEALPLERTAAILAQ